MHVSDSGTRDAVRRLAEQGALRLVERSKAGHLVEVRLPEEIRGIGASEVEGAAQSACSVNLEDADFMQSKELRQAIHGREGGFCFYCLRPLNDAMKCLDHVVPRARLGRNSYRNLVSCCLECNSLKGERSAGDFLSQLYRERRLTAAELAGRLRALAAGKLPPALPPSQRLSRNWTRERLRRRG